jgi:Arc/MetJ-type ribon-helix-helix transcriptional regulator
MSIQIPARFDEIEVAHLDEMLEHGVGPTRSHIIRIAVDDLYDRHRRAQIAAQIVASYTAVPQSAEDDEWAQASVSDWFSSAAEEPDATR